MKSLIIPVYQNESGLTALFEALEELAGRLGDDFEVVLVVDGRVPRQEGAAQACEAPGAAEAYEEEVWMGYGKTDGQEQRNNSTNKACEHETD